MADAQGTPTTFTNWSFSASPVYTDGKEGQFVSAETTLVASGPPRLSQMTGSQGTGSVYPLGLIENIAIQQSKQLQRVFEIGSARSYFIPGRVVGNFSIGRVFYHGPSLLKAMYAYYPVDKAGTAETPTDPGSTTKEGANTMPNPGNVLIEIPSLSGSAYGLYNNAVAPGADYFWLNLASDMFNQPTGMALFFKDAGGDSVGAMYLESCFIQGHQISISAGALMLMEGASAQFDRIVPTSVLTGTPEQKPDTAGAAAG